MVCLRSPAEQQVMANMHWAVLMTDGADHELLTLDRPLVHTQSLNAFHRRLSLGSRISEPPILAERTRPFLS